MRSSLLFWLCWERKLYLLKPSRAVFQESALLAPTSTECFFKEDPVLSVLVGMTVI